MRTLIMRQALAKAEECLLGEHSSNGRTPQKLPPARTDLLESSELSNESTRLRAAAIIYFLERINDCLQSGYYETNANAHNWQLTRDPYGMTRALRNKICGI